MKDTDPVCFLSGECIEHILTPFMVSTVCHLSQTLGYISGLSELLPSSHICVDQSAGIPRLSGHHHHLECLQSDLMFNPLLSPLIFPLCCNFATQVLVVCKISCSLKILSLLLNETCLPSVGTVSQHYYVPQVINHSVFQTLFFH